MEVGRFREASGHPHSWSELIQAIGVESLNQGGEGRAVG